MDRPDEIGAEAGRGGEKRPARNQKPVCQQRDGDSAEEKEDADQRGYIHEKQRHGAKKYARSDRHRGPLGARRGRMLAIRGRERWPAAGDRKA